MKSLGVPAAFFAVLRDPLLFNGPLKQSQVDGINTLLGAMGRGDWSVAWTAYGLATTFHETAAAMVPVREWGQGRGRPYGVPGRHGGQVPYGRGDVQLTWDRNYERADAELELNGALLADFDLALEPDIAARILVRGMAEGWFSGRKLGDYLPDAHGDAAAFIDARAVINGRDRAALIASYAIKFQSGLQLGSWA